MVPCMLVIAAHTNKLSLTCMRQKTCWEYLCIIVLDSPNDKLNMSAGICNCLRLFYLRLRHLGSPLQLIVAIEVLSSYLAIFPVFESFGLQVLDHLAK